MRRQSWTVAAMVGAALAADLWAHPGLRHDLECINEQMEAQPERVDLLIERARLVRLGGDAAASLADLDRALARQRDNPDALLQRGLTLSALGRDAKAVGDLSRCLELRPGIAAAYAERGRIRARQQRTEAAVADFDATIARQPSIDLYVARGRLLESLRRWDEAARGYEEGMQRLGGPVLLRQALVRVETARGRYEQALRLIDEAMSPTRVKTEWYLQRAEVQAAARRPSAAAADLRRALDEAGRAVARRATALNLVLRAKALEALGRCDEAARDLRLALEKSPRLVEAKEMLVRLEGSDPGRGGKQ